MPLFVTTSGIRTCQGENPHTLLAVISRTRKERKLDRERMRQRERKRRIKKKKIKNGNVCT